MLALLIESALRLLLLGGAVWLGLKLLRVRNPHVQMTVWSVVLVASLAMPLLMRSVTVPLPASPAPPQLAKIVWASPALPLSLPFVATAPSPARQAPMGPPAPALTPPASPPPAAAAPRFDDASSAALDWRLAATAVYLAVAALLLLRLLLGLV